ncbi:MAG: hypothetical protein K8F92_02515 [Hyphomicrobium sp.]|uniref:hypothetical protein n=1 Tax=Hyphomicrobium sp. TaxID=82 RepID=UPI0013285A8E|nr:hypothetical protein [Hyphomicrobium sp.]KAB2942544.1 MAG: hypothetical protein F9K20_06025 [Hyphomicrobium sp.]MBZ0208515.1 hypothetical protein [Hyphomicrobium sp.]
MTNYDPASREARNGIVQWILETHYLGRPADPSLLLIGLPQEPILRAEVQDDGSVLVWFRDQAEPKRERSPRRFDLAAFAALRPLLLAKAHVLFSRTDTPPRPELHDLTFGDHIKVRRIIAAAQPGQLVETVGDHRDLRRSNLRLVGAPVGPTQNWSHKGRELAVQTAVTNFEKSTDDFGLTPQEYEALLRFAFKLADDLPVAPTDKAE